MAEVSNLYYSCRGSKNFLIDPSTIAVESPDAPYSTFIIAILFSALMIYNLVYSYRVPRSTLIVSVIVASSYIVSSIGFYGVFSVLAANAENFTKLLINYGWVALDSFCVFLAVWIHISAGVRLSKSSKVVLWCLMLNSAFYLFTEFLLHQNLFLSFFTEATAPLGEDYRTAGILTFYSLWENVTNMIMFFAMGGLHILQSLRSRC